MKLRKVTMYIVELDKISDTDLEYHLTDCDYYCALVGNIESVEIPDWNDDHELNQPGGDFEKYFKKDS